MTNAFETENTKVGNETFEILVGEQVAGTISHEIRHFLDRGELIIASGKIVIEHNSRQSFTDLAAFTEFSYTVAGNTPAPWHLPVFDFRVPKALQEMGVARFVWHLISHAIPEPQRKLIRVHGPLSPSQASVRRLALFMDVCGKSSNRIGAIFDVNALGFSGPLTDPWQEAKAQFQAQACIVCSLSTSVQREEACA